jgi:hypothetical protein
MRHARKTATIMVLGFATVALQPITAKAAEAKWFVLRNQTTSDCWAAKLIQIGGAYATGSALIAGGPYSEEEAARYTRSITRRSR